jgi:hypothetical protein
VHKGVHPSGPGAERTLPNLDYILAIPVLQTKEKTRKTIRVEIDKGFD